MVARWSDCVNKSSRSRAKSGIQGTPRVYLSLLLTSLRWCSVGRPLLSNMFILKLSVTSAGVVDSFVNHLQCSIKTACPFCICHISH